MADLIDRQAAILETWREPKYTDPLNILTEMRDRLMNLPSEEPEIIRCEYCAHRNQYRFPPKYEVLDYCEVHEKVTTLTNFCAWAERRQDV